MNNLSAQRLKAKNALPEEALSTEASYLQNFEVLLAYNLESPLRFRQDYWWLEVLAQDATEARNLARDWVMREEDKRFECTDFVRPLSKHYPSFISDRYQRITVDWSIVVEKTLLPGTAIRNPSTGHRIGYLAKREREAEVLQTLPEFARDGFRLLLSRPVSSSQIVCLAPEVENTSPLYR